MVAAAKLAALFGAGRFGRVLAALTTACAPVTLGAADYGNTTAPDLLAWAVVLVCVSLALLRDKPRWWLGAGVAAHVQIGVCTGPVASWTALWPHLKHYD